MERKRKLHQMGKPVKVSAYIAVLTAISLSISGCTPRIVPREYDTGESEIGDIGGGGAQIGETSPGDLQETTETKVPFERITTPEDEPVTLKIVDWSDSTKKRRLEFHEQFMADHPNVTIEYTTITSDQFKEIIVSGLKSENAPDLFPLPQGIRLNTAVSEGWFQPMNEYASEGFFDTFEESGLNEGITTQNGQVYTLPESANIINTLMFYNKTVLAQAGYTEEDLPSTWSEFITMCSDISESGKGKYFGIIASGAQTNRLELEVRSFASLAGALCGDIGQILLRDGVNPMNSEGMQRAVGFYEDLLQAGAFHPDSTLLKAPESRALFADNQAAFLIQGSWCISTWREQNPELDFGVMPLPVPDDGMKGKLPYVNAQAWMGISSASKHPDVAMEYLEALYSVEYQAKLVGDGGFVSMVKHVNEAHMQDEVMKRYYEIHLEQAALVPDPLIADRDAGLVYEAVKDITPGLGDIVQGTLSSAIDYKKELVKLSDKTQKEWMRAIEEAGKRKKGIEAADFEFTNWDQMSDYSQKKYEEREGGK